jgi:diguanylate cyclase (GGDEF)-like protein
MGAKILAERLRDSIEKSVFNINGEKISITISIGIRNADIKLNFDSGSEVTKLINQADIALYNAKANGRNRVEVYIEDMDTVEKDVKGDNPILDKEIHISERFTH